MRNIRERFLGDTPRPPWGRAGDTPRPRGAALGETAMDRYPVIDCDGHVEEMNGDLERRIAEPYRARAPRKLTDNRGNPRVLVEGRIWPASDGPHPGTGAPKSEKATKHRVGMSDPQARLQDMDQEGIDVALLFGTSVTLCVNGLQDGELAGAL